MTLRESGQRRWNKDDFEGVWLWPNNISWYNNC